jgi:hypothetical protein
MGLNFPFAAWKAAGAKVGRFANNTQNRTGTPSVTFSPAAKQGSILILGSYDSNGLGAVVAGGAAWTTLYSVGGLHLYWKYAGASEPTSYSVTSGNGGSKQDNCSLGVQEILTPSAGNLDASALNSSSTTPPAATALGGGRISVIWGGGIAAASAPSGYTLCGSSVAGVSFATKTGVSGVETPGAWPATSGENATILIK